MKFMGKWCFGIAIGFRCVAFFAFALSAFLYPGGAVSAHEVSSVSLISNLDTNEGTYLLDAAMEVIPSDDDFLNEQIPPEEAAREFAEEYLVTLFDDAEQTPELEISIESASDENTPAELQRKQVLVKMSGAIPKGAKEFLLYLESTCPMAVVMVVIKDEKPSRRMQVILPGEYSRPVVVLPVQDGDPFEAGESAEEGKEEGGAESFSEAAERTGFASGWQGFWTASFLPLALVLSLFLMTTERRPVFIQFACFMIGLSLAISTLLWQLFETPAWMEVATALVLVFLAGEVLVHSRFKGWRFPLCFAGGFGAGALTAQEILRRSPELSAETQNLGKMISIVLGAEVALIAAGVAAAALFLAMGRFDWYRKTVVTPVAVVLVGVGLFQLIEPFL
ncbi:MAG: hypothetical protein AAF733_05715 [Verrucomicrobiota bacterium]